MGQAPERSEDFAERLQRIEGKQSRDPETPEVSVADVAALGGGRAKPISRVRIGLILLTMVGIFGMGAMTILNLTEGYEQAAVKPVVVRR